MNLTYSKIGPLLRLLVVISSAVAFGAALDSRTVAATFHEAVVIGWFTRIFTLTALIWLLISYIPRSPLPRLNSPRAVQRCLWLYLPLIGLTFEQKLPGDPLPWVIFLSLVGFVGAETPWRFGLLQSSAEHPRVAATLVASAVFSVSMLYNAGLFATRPFPSGDEPSYLMIARSLVEDKDLILDNNYHAKAFRDYGLVDYPMFTHLGKNRLNYPHHGLGLPLLLTPAVAAGANRSEVLRNLLVRSELSLLGACLIYHVFLLGMTLGVRPVALVKATCLVALSPPFFFYLSEAYPEILTALIAVLALRLISASNKRRRAALCTGVLMGYLPWLGIKYFAICAGLIIAVAISNGKREKWGWYVSIVLPFAVSMCIFFAFIYSVYGNLNPSSIYYGIEGPPVRTPSGDGDSGAAALIARFGSAVNFLVGVWLEQRMGLLFLMPASLFALPGLYLLWKRNRAVAATIGIPFSLHLLFYAYHNNWGGYCPPNRPVIAMMPLLTLAFAEAMPFYRRGVWAIFSSAASVLGLISTLSFMRDPRMLYHTMNPHLAGGSSRFLDALATASNWPLTELFPLIMGPVKHTISNVLWCVGTGILVGMMIWRVKRCRWTFTGVAVRPLSSQLWFFSRIFLFVPILVWHVFFPTPGALTSVQNIPVYLSSSGVHLPESNGVWLEGPGTIRLALLRHSRDAKFLFTVHSLVPNTLGILAGGSFFSANLSPEARTSFELAPQNGIGMHGREWIKCRIGIKAGAVPKEIWENSLDPRKLGVFLSIQQTDANLSPSH